jgi:hypothetical protein
VHEGSGLAGWQSCLRWYSYRQFNLVINAVPAQQRKSTPVQPSGFSIKMVNRHGAAHDRLVARFSMWR